MPDKAEDEIRFLFFRAFSWQNRKAQSILLIGFASDAHQQIAAWIEGVYMTDRVHSALDYLTPAEFEAAYWAAQGTGVTLKT